MSAIEALYRRRNTLSRSACHELTRSEMILVPDLRALARARLKDAEVLLQSGRHDASYYVCGYAVEIALKARICRTMKWPGFPASRKEFERLVSFKTHDLEALLHLSGSEAKVVAKVAKEWSIVRRWDPEVRYRSVGTTTAQDASEMVTATNAVMAAL